MATSNGFKGKVNLNAAEETGKKNVTENKKPTMETDKTNSEEAKKSTSMEKNDKNATKEAVKKNSKNAGKKITNETDDTEKEPSQKNPIDEVVKKLANYERVEGVMVLDQKGAPIKVTFDRYIAALRAALLHSAILKSVSAVRELNPGNEIISIRVTTKKNEEILMGISGGVTVIVFQSLKKEKKQRFW